MSDIDLIIVVVMFLAGYWIVSYFWPGAKDKERGENGSDADETDDRSDRPRR